MNVPEPGSQRPFRIIGKLGNIVTSLWTGKSFFFEKGYHHISPWIITKTVTFQSETISPF